MYFIYMAIYFYFLLDEVDSPVRQLLGSIFSFVSVYLPCNDCKTDAKIIVGGKKSVQGWPKSS